MSVKKNDVFQVPLMFAFRDAFEKGDARKALDTRVEGERVVSARGSLKRRGADEALLKRNLSVDLVSLANTIDLASATDLAEFQYVSRSVLNFGFADIAHMTSADIGVEQIARNLRQALMQHEPRLHPDSLKVARNDVYDDVNQRIRFTVAAEMACRPFDIPIEFVAEVDVAGGKLHLTRLPVSQ